MADEWVCDECGYSTSLEPEANECPACKSKMTKIDSVDDLLQYDEDEENGEYKDGVLAKLNDEDEMDDEDFSWEDDKDDTDKKK